MEQQLEFPFIVKMQNNEYICAKLAMKAKIEELIMAMDVLVIIREWRNEQCRFGGLFTTIIPEQLELSLDII